MNKKLDPIDDLFSELVESRKSFRNGKYIKSWRSASKKIINKHLKNIKDIEILNEPEHQNPTKIHHFLIKGREYTRSDIHKLYFGIPMHRIGTGNWTTGYVQPKNTNDLVVFLNINIEAKTGHNFDNKFNDKSGLITWYGKPKSHSAQPTFRKLIMKELEPQFFARWDHKSVFFKYLGSGEIIEFQDNVDTAHGPTIKLKVQCI